MGESGRHEVPPTAPQLRSYSSLDAPAEALVLIGVSVEQAARSILSCATVAN